MTKIIGILGLGSIGLRHARNATALGAEILGYDASPEKRQAVEMAVVDTPEALFKQADAIVIATPNRFHLENLQQAIAAGKPVLIEKPLGHTDKGLDDVIEQAHEKGVLVAPAMNLRFSPVVKAAKSALDENNLGKIIWARFVCHSFLPDWRPQQDYRQGYTVDAQTGGVIFDIIHEFDLAYHLLGPAEVKACIAWQSGLLETQAEDCADTALGHVNGVISTLHLSYASRHVQRYFELQMGNGYIRGDLVTRSIRVLDKNSQVIIDKVFEGPDDEDYVAEMQAFLEALDKSTPYICTLEEACDVLGLALEARRQAGLPELKE